MKAGNQKVLILGIIAAIMLTIIVIIPFSDAAPAVSWVTTTSTNCGAQGLGNTMIEVNGNIYTLLSNTDQFQKYDPQTGNCNPINLASFPGVGVGSSTDLVKIDDETIYAISSTKTYIYKIPLDTWISYDIAKANDGTMSETVNESGLQQNYGNSIVRVNNDLYMFLGGGGVFLKYTPSTNFMTPSNSAGSLPTIPGAVISNGAALAYPGTGNFIYAFAGNSSKAYRYTIDTGWTSMADTPTPVGAGSALTFVGTDLYAFGGNGTNYFWKFDTTQTLPGSWVNLTSTNPLPDLVYGGATMTTIGTNIYAFQGNYTEKFWKYNSVTGVWSELKDAPQKVAAGGSLTTDNNFIYATRGIGSKDFWQYDPSTNNWITLVDTPTGVGNSFTGGSQNFMITSKGGIAYFPNGPSGSPEIYLSTGNGNGTTTGLIFRYKIATNEWPIYKTPPDAPISFNYGSAVEYPGIGDFIYALKGSAGKAFWKYILSQNIWVPNFRSKIASGEPISLNTPLNHTQNSGNSITEVNGKIITLSPKFHSYDPALNKWEDLPVQPFNISSGMNIVKFNNNTIYAIGSSNTFYKYDFQNQHWTGFSVGKTLDGKPFSQLGSNEGVGSSVGNTNLNQTRGSVITEVNGKLYILRGQSSDFLRFDPVQNTWVQLANIGSTVGSGSALLTVGTDIYALAGNNLSTFYKYDTVNNIWTTLNSAPNIINAGGSLTYDGNNTIYAFRGANSNEFYKYSISENAWTNLTSTSPAPANVQAGGSLTKLDTDLYAFAGNNTTNFWKFDTVLNAWTNLTSTNPTPVAVRSGGSLTTDGTYIYATGGAGTNRFWKYDPSLPSGSRWTTLNTLPVTVGTAIDTTTQGGIIYSQTLDDIYAIPGDGIGDFTTSSKALIFRYQLNKGNSEDNTWPIVGTLANAPGSFSTGAALAYPGTENFIYAFQGNIGAGTAFWRYDTVNNTWNVMKTTPGLVASGGALVGTDSNSIYAFQGNNTTANNFWRYDIIANTWTTLTSPPGGLSIRGGASLTYDGVNTIYASRGNATKDFWKYIITNPATGAGTWTTLTSSPVNIGVTGTLAAGGISFYNGNVWTAPGYGSSVINETNVPLLFRYETTTNTWPHFSPVSDVSEGATNGAFSGGSDLASTQDGSKLFALQGDAGTGNFWEYNIAANTWQQKTKMPNNITPVSIKSGGSLAVINDNTIYALRGNSTNEVYKYNITGNTWSTAPTLPITVGASPASSSDNRGEIIFSPSTNKVFVSPGSGSIIYSLAANPRAYIQSISDPANGPSFTPRAGSPFDVVIESADSDGSPYIVASDTEITLSLKNGTGILGGTLSGTILTGQSQTTISGVTYSKSENGIVILTADTTDGINHTLLTPDESAAFNVSAGTVSASSSTVTATPLSLPADAVATSTVTVTLKDTVNNLINGKIVSLTQTGGSGNAIISSIDCGLGTTPGTSDANGKTCFTVKSLTPEVATFQATDTTDEIVLSTQVQLDFRPVTNVHGPNSSAVVSPTTIAADSVTVSTITATIRDPNNLPIPNILVTISDSGNSGDINYNPTNKQQLTNSSGVAVFQVSSSVQSSFTFTLIADPNGGSVTLNTVNVEFTCVSGVNEQCLSVQIEESNILSLTVPDSFAFLPSTPSGSVQNRFSNDDPNYQLNNNSLVIVEDLRNSSGFNLQVTASAFTDSVNNIPLENFFVGTSASSTGGTTINGVEYSANSSGPQTIIAPTNINGSLTDPNNFTINLGNGLNGIPVDLMQGGLDPSDPDATKRGRIDEFKQNVNYLVKIPADQPSGQYQVTLTFDLSDDNN